MLLRTDFIFVNMKQYIHSSTIRSDGAVSKRKKNRRPTPNTHTQHNTHTHTQLAVAHKRKITLRSHHGGGRPVVEESILCRGVERSFHEFFFFYIKVCIVCVGWLEVISYYYTWKNMCFVCGKYNSSQDHVYTATAANRDVTRGRTTFGMFSVRNTRAVHDHARALKQKVSSDVQCDHRNGFLI